jgi:hypothetical protein
VPVFFFDFDFRSLLEPGRDEYGTPVSAGSPKIVSESLTSPDNVYAIEEARYAPKQAGFIVSDKNGNTIRWLVYTDKKEVDPYDGSSSGCDCKASFKGWINNHTFVIRTIKEDGREYENIIDIKKLL